mgnify:CR=1 FL=1
MKTINKKLKLRSWRRGTKEMDLILGQFADKNIDNLSEKDLFTYNKLLKCDDHQIYDWILSKEKIPKNFEKIVTCIKKSLEY